MSEPAILPEIGFHAGVPNDAYRAWPVVSRSDLRALFSGKPYSRVLWEREHPKETDESQIVGRALHALVLEGGVAFHRDFYVAEKVDRRTKEGKAAWAAMEAEAGDRSLLAADDAVRVRGMADSLYANRWVMDILADEDTQTELSVLFEESLFDLGVVPDAVLGKCRLDALNVRRQDIVDLKSCPDASPEGFGGFFTMKNWIYQAAWYVSGVELVTEEAGYSFNVVAVEDHPPYDCTVYPVAPEVVNAAWDKLRFWWAGYERCCQSGVWPGYDPVQPMLQVRGYQVRSLLEG